MNGAKITIKASGLKEFTKKLEDLKPKVLLTGQSAIKTVSKAIYDQTITDTPRDTGALVNSTFRDTAIEEGKVIAVVGLGGDYRQMNPVTGLSTDYYAVDRHEFMGGAFTNKWLEIATVANEDDFNKELATQLGKLFDTGEATSSDLPDNEHHVEDVIVEGSRAYEHKMKKEGTRR